MYATLIVLRFNLDDEYFYGIAANPPILHWQAAHRSVTWIKEEQFPLGLLPISGFTAKPLSMEPGDVIVIATDGFSEVCSRQGMEFGADGLASVMRAHTGAPLPKLAACFFESVRSYGRQVDDQTLL